MPELKSSPKSISLLFSFWHFPIIKMLLSVRLVIPHTSHAFLKKLSKWAVCLSRHAQLLDLCPTNFPSVARCPALMRSVELVIRSGSCGVTEVSSLLSVPLPSCLPDVSSARERKSACQIDCFHLIKPAPWPLCLSFFPSQWVTLSVNRPVDSFLQSPSNISLSDTRLLLEAHKYPWVLTRKCMNTCKIQDLIFHCIYRICALVTDCNAGYVPGSAKGLWLVSSV